MTAAPRRSRLPRPLKLALPLLLLTTPFIFIAYVIFTFTRPLATRGDIQSLVTGVLNSDATVASEICGAPVDSLLWPTPKIGELSYGEWPWAKVELQTMMPLLSRDGTITARVSGIGVDHDQKPLTDMRVARITFSYRCVWEDNGRSNNFRCNMTSTPVVARETK